MPKYTTPPELKDALSEPIEFELCGETYTVERVPPKALTIVKHNMQNAGGAELLEFMGGLMEHLIGKTAWKAIENKVDLRELRPLSEWLSKQILSADEGLSGEEKNSGGARGG